MNSQQNSKIEIQKSSPTSHFPLLLEIGTEEIPARFLPDAVVKLKENAEKIFSEFRLSFKSIKTYATPRRLSLIAEIEPFQMSIEKEMWGPPVNAAFDKDGKPTKAAEAFARTHGLKIENLIKKEKGKGTYIVAVIKEDAQKTSEVLLEVLPKLVLSLHFPKAMRWGSGDIRFVRPIHWILAMYNNERIRFEIDGIKSGMQTRGHRFLSPGAFEIKDIRTYINLLRNNFVVLDIDERGKRILDEAGRLADSVNASLMIDEDLLQHVVFLVEYPVPVLGTFPSDYLALPEELLITVMKDHQKYFALTDKNGKLSNYFIVISNTKKDNSENITKGAEKVIKARFEDARFYYEEDKKVSLKERLDGLKKVIYHDKVGSLYDKSQRIASIADFVADRCCPERKDDIHTLSLLSKTDLISGVVREFPELQGIMGGYYALNDGYNKEIANAISEQYLPAHSGDRLPESGLGAILSLSDKLDNIASFFMLGLTPTGTEDPFALRRQAMGTVSILIDRRYNFNIGELLDRALQPFDIKNRQNLLNDIIKFFEQRIEYLFLSNGYSADSISAIINFAKDKPLYTLKERLDAIKKFKEEDADYDSFLLVIKRVNNIAPKNEPLSVKKELFVHEEEVSLFNELELITPQIHSILEQDKYYDAIKLLKTLKEPINRFFDRVLVMDKKEEVKLNRLSLIKNIQLLAQQIADFSKLS